MKNTNIQKLVPGLLITLIVFAALLARICGIGWGDLIAGNHDERVHLITAYSFYGGEFNVKNIINSHGIRDSLVFYPWFGMYIVALVGWLYGLISYMGSLFSFLLSSQPEIKLSSIRMMPIREFLLLGRLVVALAGTMTVYITYRIGRRLISKRVGLIAAAFLAFNCYHIANCHWLKNDILALFLLTLALLFITRVKITGLLRDYLAAAFFSALAVASKYNYFPVLALLLFVHWQRKRAGGCSWWKVFIDPKLLITGLFYVIIVFLVSPVLYQNGLVYIVNYMRYLWQLPQSFLVSGSHKNLSQSFIVGCLARTVDLISYTIKMKAGMGLYVPMLGVIGILYCWLCRKRDLVFLTIFPLGYCFFIVLMTANAGLRFQEAIPLYPFLSLLAAVAIVKFWDRFGRRWKNLLTGVTVGIFLFPYLIAVIQLDFGYWQLSTHVWGSRWVIRNIPPGCTIVREKRTVSLEREKYNIFTIRDFWKIKVDKLREDGVDYLFAATRNEDQVMGQSGLFSSPHPGEKFYSSLPEEYRLIKAFNLGVIPYRGGGVKVWQLRRDAPFCPAGMNSSFIRRIQSDLCFESEDILFIDPLGRCEGNTNFIVPPECQRGRILISPVSLPEIGLQILNGNREGKIYVRERLKKRAEKFKPGKKRQYIFTPDSGFPFIKSSYHVSVSSSWKTPCLVRIQPDMYSIGLGYYELGEYEKALTYLKKAAQSAPNDWYPLFLLSSAYNHLGMKPESVLYQAEINKTFPEYGSAISQLTDNEASIIEWQNRFKKWSGYSASWMACRTGYIWYAEDLSVVKEDQSGICRLKKSRFYLPSGEYRIRIVFKKNAPKSLLPFSIKLARDNHDFKKWVLDKSSPGADMVFSNSEFGIPFTLSVETDSNDFSGIKTVYLSPTINFFRSRVKKYLTNMKYNGE